MTATVNYNEQGLVTLLPMTLQIPYDSCNKRVAGMGPFHLLDALPRRGQFHRLPARASLLVS